MKLYSQTLELKAIRTIAVKYGLQDGEGNVASLSTDKSALLSSRLLASLDPSFFQYAPAAAAFARITKVAEKRSRILSYDDLLEDPSIDEEFRDLLREEKKRPAKTKAEAREMLHALGRYRQLRISYEISKTLASKLQDSKADPEELMEFVVNKVTEARRSAITQEKIHTIGKGGNAHDLVDRVLNPTTEMLHSTGYTEFDTRNGGVPAEGVWILAGTTSGGKSVLRMNIMEHMYLKNNLDCLTVSLEMNEEKEARRLTSAITRIPLWKIAKGVLTDKDRKKIKKAWRRFYQHGEENDCRYALFCPNGGLGAQQLFTLIEPFKYKVVALDYVGLLEGVDEKDQWKTLSAIVRHAKIFSRKNKCLVIVLAQLDSESDNIRYSRGMLEHADACWKWNYSKPEQRDLKEIPVQQAKARDQELFPFNLKEEFEIMRVSNPDNIASDDSAPQQEAGPDDDEAELIPDDGSRKKKKKRRNNGDDDEGQVRFIVD